MLGRGFMGLSGGIGQASFRSATSDIGSLDADLNITINKPAGLALGDLVVILGFGAAAGANLKTRGGATWNRHELTGIGGVGSAIIWWRVMATTGDVSGSPWSVQAGQDPGGVSTVAYIPNGATGIAIRSEVADATGQSSMSLTGFMPTGYGALVMFTDRDPDSTPAISPNYWTNRLSTVIGGFYTARVWELIDYNGGAVSLSSLAGGSNFAEAGFLLEFT